MQCTISIGEKQAENETRAQREQNVILLVFEVEVNGGCVRSITVQRHRANF